LVSSAEGGLRAAALAIAVACGVLVLALVTRDFSVRYVADHSSRDLSFAYTLSAFWAGQGGSLLLWTALLSGAGALFTGARRERLGIGPAVPAVMAAVVLLFAVLVLVENPFRRGAAPADGQGLNPLLQNYAQLLHPVATYAGFVGFTVPFALVVAALLGGAAAGGAALGRGAGWVRVADTWTLASWLSMTLGIVLGARWAYSELGWGGYWGWDPVENASLLPWLTGTALLHTGIADRRTGRVRLGGALLAVITFLLCIFGTFLTRSGVVSSVHAFGESGVGPVLGVGILLFLLASGGLLVWRLPELTAARQRSRRATRAMLVLLLSVIAVAVFWGTVFPVVARAVNGQQASVGRRFFEVSVTPAGLALLALFAVGPLLGTVRGPGWRRAVALLVGVLVLAGGGVLLLSGGAHPMVALVVGLSGAAALTVTRSFVTRLRSGRSPQLLAHAAAPYLAHLGVVLLLAAVSVNSAYQRQQRVELTAGQTVVAGAYRVGLDEVSAQQATDRVTFLAGVRIAPAGGGDGVRVDTRQVAFASNEQPIAEVGIRASWTGDLYVVLESVDLERRTATVTVFDNPAVPWIWAGGWLLLAAAVAAVAAAAPRPRAGEARRAGEAWRVGEAWRAGEAQPVGPVVAAGRDDQSEGVL
jgi:cytochrome c-type biogenesis protein CcmF